jgi:hypothetical protein
VKQINIIYQREYDLSKYNCALSLFLKWSRIFEEHREGGFLFPLDGEFVKFIQGKSEDF